MQLARAHPGDRIERAAGIAVHRGAFRLLDLRGLIEHDETVVQIDFLQTHPLIRDLSAYRVEAFSAP